MAYTTLTQGKLMKKRKPRQIDPNRYYTATQFQLISWRFRKHKLATIGSIILFLYLVIVVFAEFIAPYKTQTRNTQYKLGKPQLMRMVDSEGKFHLQPFVYGSTTERNKVTLRLEVIEDVTQIIPLSFFYHGEPYKLWGLIPTDLHLAGTKQGSVHFMGTDELGRDLFSRLIYGTRVSLSIGVLGVFISFVLGLLIGGLSGYASGWVDYIIQRLIEFIRSIPTLPLWMALSAAFPKEWPSLRIYFAITILLSLIGWTNLARRVRGKLLSMRNEDFVVAAIVAGSSDFRIISRHLLPSFLSYIIVDLSVSFPYMILGETALSFVGLGLRPPIVSWGTLLQASQNIRSISQYPWLFIPALFVILAVLAFSFVGDGLRDAADPYSR
jgi:peptide/nickel transport system permease protein